MDRSNLNFSHKKVASLLTMAMGMAKRTPRTHLQFIVLRITFDWTMLRFSKSATQFIVLRMYSINIVASTSSVPPSS